MAQNNENDYKFASSYFRVHRILRILPSNFSSMIPEAELKQNTSKVRLVSMS